LDTVRKAIGPEPALYVDSNGALTRKQAIEWAHKAIAEAKKALAEA